MKKLIITFLILHLAVSNADDLYGKGYTIISGNDVSSNNATDLEVTNNLEAIVYREITAKNIKQGVLQIIRGSGYKLAKASASDPEIYRLYNQIYPDNKRDLGPIRIDDALEQLIGRAWNLVVDPTNRLVSFQLSRSYKCFTTKVKSCPASK